MNEKIRLRYICTIETGDHDTQDAEKDGIYPFYVRSPIIEKSNTSTFNGPGILIAGDGAGAGRIFHNVEGEYAVHQRVYRLANFSSKVNKDFLFYSISNRFPAIMDMGSAQSTVPSVRLPMLKDFTVYLPSHTEQQQIVKFLDRKCTAIDTAIEKTKKSIEKLEEYKKAVITKAVTKGIDPNAKMKDSGVEWIGEIPEEWEVKQLRTYFSRRINKNIYLQESNLLSLSYGHIVRKNIDTKEGLLPESFDGYNIVEDGDIVIRGTDLQNDHRSLRTGLVTERGIITSATWSANKEEAERTGNKDLLEAAKGQLEIISKEQESLLDFKKDLKKYCSAYTYISQIVDLGEPDLEIFYGFAKLLLKRLDGTPLEDIDISSLVLSDYRISELTHKPSDDEPVLRPMGSGAGTSKKKRTTLKEVIAKLNEAFGENVSPVDGARTVNAIVDSVSADDVSRIQIRNSTNSREAIIADGRLENIIKVAALSLKNNELGQLATQILDDPQAIRPIAEMIYDLVNKKKHLDVEEISEYANNKE